MTSAIHNPPIPYCGPLPLPLQPGTLIRIQGTVSPSPTCFSINLQSGSSTVPRSDVALHLSPVFSPPPRVVRNSFQNQQWGPEESHGSYFPFSAGQGFEIFILSEANQFKIAVNGQHFTEFQHRLSMYSVSHISVDGDVTVNRINFESTTSPLPSPQGGDSGVSRPLGFVMPQQGADPAAPSYGAPGASSLPYPTGNFGPQQQPVTSYGPPSPSGAPYSYPSNSNPYGPPPTMGGSSYPCGPPSSGQYGPSNNPYGPSAGVYPGQGTSVYPGQGTSVYPGQGTGYPSQGAYSGPYPSQPGPYPGTTVVYPGQEKNQNPSSLGSLASGAAAALAGLSGAALAGAGKKHKHGHGLNPASMLTGGIGSLLSPGHAKHGGRTSPIPIGGAVAGGAAALAGAYMLSKSPLGKVMKPKKMKKLYKHKHKLKHGFKGFGSSSSSSSSDEE